MITLYLDTSSSFLYTAIIKNDTVIAEIKEKLGNNLSEYTLPRIEEMIKVKGFKPDDINKIIDRMPHHGWRVDYVVSHDLPTPIKREAFHGVLYGPHSSSDLLWDLANQIDFSAWYGAHLHLSYNSMIGDKEFIVLNINEIQEVF